MSKSLLIVLLLGLAHKVLADDCELDLGRYVIAGGSEIHTALTFSSDGTVVLEHENWIPGQYQDRRRWKMVGTWSCRKLDVSFLLGETAYSAILMPAGPNNIFRIDADTLILHVIHAIDVADVVNRRIFYDEGLLE